MTSSTTPAAAPEVSTSFTDDAMPFEFRFTDKGSDQNVQIEIGDMFVRRPSFGDDDRAMMRQVGLRMAYIGLRLYGLGPDAIRVILALADGALES